MTYKNIRGIGNNLGKPILDGAVAPELRDAISKILRAAQTHGKKCAIYSTSGEQAKAYGDQGFDMICVATDATALQQTMTETLSIARGELNLPGRGKSY